MPPASPLPEPLSSPEREALLATLRAISQGHFFEAHEVLEAAWASCRTANRPFLQAIIHVAVGAHHAVQQNPVGMRLQFEKAIRKLQPFSPCHESIDIDALSRQLQTILESPEPYSARAAAIAINIPRK